RKETTESEVSRLNDLVRNSLLYPGDDGAIKDTVMDYFTSRNEESKRSSPMMVVICALY
ncbi:hypothetical protein M9458_037276, partial [Cirrhinus mrigala]